MKNKCDYVSFINEFTISNERKLYVLPLYKGFYFTKNYKKHLNKIIENFKHDLLYKLPFEESGNKEIFLLNIYKELSRKQSTLRQYNRKRQRTKNRFQIKGFTKIKKMLILNPLIKFSPRRIYFMRYKQVNTINIALIIIKQAAENFDIDLEKLVKAECTLNFGTWSGSELEFLQLLHSLFKSGKIKTRNSQVKAVIESMSKALNVEITANTLSSLSRSIHSNNYDYSPQIFDTLLDGYKDFVTERQRKSK